MGVVGVVRVARSSARDLAEAARLRQAERVAEEAAEHAWHARLAEAAAKHAKAEARLARDFRWIKALHKGVGPGEEAAWAARDPRWIKACRRAGGPAGEAARAAWLAEEAAEHAWAVMLLRIDQARAWAHTEHAWTARASQAEARAARAAAKAVDASAKAAAEAARAAAEARAVVLGLHDDLQRRHQSRRARRQHALMYLEENRLIRVTDPEAEAGVRALAAKANERGEVG